MRRRTVRAMPPPDRYGPDVLATDWRAPKRGRAVDVPADKGLVVEEVGTDWCGEIVAVERDLGTVTLEDRHGKRRTFPLGPGFMLEPREGPRVVEHTSGDNLDCDLSTETRISRAIDLTHPAGTDRRQNVIGSEARAASQPHVA